MARGELEPNCRQEFGFVRAPERERIGSWALGKQPAECGSSGARQGVGGQCEVGLLGPRKFGLVRTGARARAAQSPAKVSPRPATYQSLGFAPPNSASPDSPPSCLTTSSAPNVQLWLAREPPVRASVVVHFPAGALSFNLPTSDEFVVRRGRSVRVGIIII